MLNSNAVMGDDFEHHLHLPSDLSSFSQEAAEVAFNLAVDGLCLSALPVGFAGV
ncbi:MAG: hypothetical protein AAGB26_07430 [Planctomycetota bacterium]